MPAFHVAGRGDTAYIAWTMNCSLTEKFTIPIAGTFVFAALCHQGMPATTRQNDFQVRATGFSSVAVQNRVSRWSEDAEAEVRRCAKLSAAGMNLTFRPGSKAPVISNGKLVYRLDEALPMAENLPHIVCALLLRRMAAVGKSARPQPEMVPEWLVAALSYRVLNRIRAPHPGPNQDKLFVSCKLMADANRIPRLRRLLEQPMPRDYPVLYQLYGEACALLLKLLLDHDEQVIARLMQQPAPADELFVLLTAFDSERAIQYWYEDAVGKQVTNVVTPSSYDRIRRQLHELETVPILKSGNFGTFGYQRVPIEDVGYVLNTYKNKQKRIDALRAGFYELQQSSPAFLRPALTGHIEALALLEKGKQRSFVKRVRAARAQFEEDFKRGCAIEAYLKSVEDGNGRSLYNYKTYFRILERDSRMRFEYERRIEMYLETFEAKLAGGSRR